MTAPVFIEVHDYRQVLDRLDMLKAHLFETSRLVKEISELRDQERDQIAATQERLVSLQNSLAAVQDEI